MLITLTKIKSKFCICISERSLVISVVVNNIEKYYEYLQITEATDISLVLNELLTRVPAEYRKLKIDLVYSSQLINQRYIKIPKPAAQPQEKQMLYWELSKILATKIEDYYWYYKKVDEIKLDDSITTGYSVFFITKKLIDQVLNVLKNNNLKIENIISDDILIDALLSVKNLSASPENLKIKKIADFKGFILFLDVDIFSLMYISNNTIAFKRNLDTISSEAIKSLCANSGQKIEQFIKNSNDFGVFPYIQPQTAEISNKQSTISNTLKNFGFQIIDEQKKTFQFISSVLSITPEKNLFICGDLSNIPGIIEFFKSETGWSVEHLEFSNDIFKNQIKRFQILSSIYLDNIKLLQLYSSKKQSDTKIDAKVQMFSQTSNNRLLYSSLILLVITMIITPIMFLKSKNTLLKNYQELQANLEWRIQRENQDTESSNNSNLSVDKNLKLFFESRNYNFASIISTIGNNAINGLTIEHLFFKQIDNNDITSKTLVIISGYSLTPTLVPEFILKLENTKLFNNIILSQSQRTEQKNRTLTFFEIHAELKDANLQ